MRNIESITDRDLKNLNIKDYVFIADNSLNIDTLVFRTTIKLKEYNLTLKREKKNYVIYYAGHNIGATPYLRNIVKCLDKDKLKRLGDKYE